MEKETLVFATNNPHKLEELKKLLSYKYKILGLKDIGITEDIPEPFETLEENARAKSNYVYQRKKVNCFSDDTGLEIDALDGAPGVYSARYAGENASYQDNVDKVLKLMEGKSNRTARFKTNISLILDGQEYQFEGKVEGFILTDSHGSDGFGYDPIFRPDGYTETFAEMNLDEKNKISHRGKAVEKLADFLLNKRK